jgi:hypothetical protein
MKVLSMVVVLGASTVLFGVGPLVRRRGRHEEKEIESVRSPHIRVLRTDEEVLAALARAAQGERAIAEVARARADRYEASLRPRPSAVRGDGNRRPVETSAAAVPARARIAESLAVDSGTGVPPADRWSA